MYVAKSKICICIRAVGKTQVLQFESFNQQCTNFVEKHTSKLPRDINVQEFTTTVCESFRSDYKCNEDEQHRLVCQSKGDVKEPSDNDLLGADMTKVDEGESRVPQGMVLSKEFVTLVNMYYAKDFELFGYKMIDPDTLSE